MTDYSFEPFANSSIQSNKYKIYKNILDNANDIILIMTRDGRIIDANRRAIKSYGYPYDELLAMSIFDFRDPNNLGLVQRQFDLAKTDEDGIEFETVHYRKDGTFFPVEVKAVGIHDGPDYRIVSIIRDITLRRKREGEMRNLASIVESSEDAIYGTSVDGTIYNWNNGAAKLFGYSKEEILGKHVSLLVPPESEDDVDEIIARVKNKEKMESYEAIRQRKDGTNIRVFISISPIYDFEGIFTGVSIIARDLTEKYILTKKVSEQEEKWRLANELLTANIFQTSLMSKVQRFNKGTMYGRFIPCSMVGGDFYGCVENGESLWFIMADVAGHGLVSAMISTMLNGIFQYDVYNYNYPNEILENMNSTLSRLLNNHDVYLVSAFIGVIRKKTLYYSNAGHPYPIVVNCEDKKVRIIGDSSYLLALRDNTRYDLKKVPLSESDAIVLYTDGVFNLRKGSQNDYWDEISSFSLQNVDLMKNDPQGYIEKLINTFRSNYGKEFDDDVSLMMIKQ